MGKSTGAVASRSALGRPEGEDYEEDHLALADELEAARERMTFAADERSHRRGEFFVKAHGRSFGGGQEVRPTSPPSRPPLTQF